MQGTPAQVLETGALCKKQTWKPLLILELFESLCKKGILKASLPLPRNLKTLETYISDINLNPHYGGNNIVTENRKKAILAVSFGTSHHDTCKVTIDAIEKEMQAAFPDYPLYRAWTSKMIIRKLKDRDQIHVNTVKEAMEQMRRDGITDVLIQPTHVINGIENDLMKEDALSYRRIFTPFPLAILCLPANRTAGCDPGHCRRIFQPERRPGSCFDGTWHYAFFQFHLRCFGLYI